MGINAVSRFRPEIISYKGHGQIERATKSGSVGHVLLHELRHKLEFEAQARREGKRIVREDIDINFAFRDGTFVAVSGKTTVATAPKKDDVTTAPLSDEDRQPHPGESPSDEDRQPRPGEPPSPMDTPSPFSQDTPGDDGDSLVDAASKIRIEQRLRMADQRTNSALHAIETRLRRGDGEMGDLEAKRTKLQQIRSEVDRIRRQMQFEQAQTGSEQVLQTAVQADRLALSMITAAAGPPTGNRQDRDDGAMVPPQNVAPPSPPSPPSKDGDRHVLSRLTEPVRRRTDVEMAISRIITTLSAIAPPGGAIDVTG
jgi:hypothetical protein